jgi:hypothetical protein
MPPPNREINPLNEWALANATTPGPSTTSQWRGDSEGEGDIDNM